MKNYNDPLFIQWHRNKQGESQSVKIGPEDFVLIRDKIFLTQIPDPQYKVYIPGMSETEGEVYSKEQFKVDYTNGMVSFHSSLNQETIKGVEYYGRGVILYPASRIYTEIDDINGVIHTLDEIDLDLGETVETIQDLNAAIREALTASEGLIELKNESQFLLSELSTQNDDSQYLIKILREVHSIASPLIAELERKTETALKINDSLSENIEQIEDLTEKAQNLNKQTIDLKKEITSLEENLIRLQEILMKNITAGEIVNRKLGERILRGNPLEKNLEGLISKGSDLLKNLESIINGTDYSELLKRLESLEFDSHTHDNFDVIKDISENSGELMFRGKMVGQGDMKKDVYDPYDSGYVLRASNSLSLGGKQANMYALKDEIPKSSTQLTDGDRLLKKGVKWGDFI